MWSRSLQRLARCSRAAAAALPSCALRGAAPHTPHLPPPPPLHSALGHAARGFAASGCAAHRGALPGAAAALAAAPARRAAPLAPPRPAAALALAPPPGARAYGKPAAVGGKMKLPSSFKERFKRTANGHFLRMRVGKRHCAAAKSRPQRRRLRKKALVPPGRAAIMRKLGFKFSGSGR
jgi:ribosomal protein L35